jgi:hypothetical protein
MATSIPNAPEMYPFRVFVAPPPLLADGNNVRVIATLSSAPAIPDTVTEIDGFVDAFWMLAASGGLSGDLIIPHESQIAEKSDVVVQGNVLTWDLSGCRIDERAVLNLLNLLRFEHLRNRFTAVEIHCGASKIKPLAVKHRLEDYYPKMYRPPFHLTVNGPISESVVVNLRLMDVPTPSQVEAFEDELLSWSVAPSVGAFAVPGVAIHATGMIPAQSVEASDTAIIWAIERFRMHPAAIDSLVNCCTALSHRIAAIAAVEIS